MARTTTTKTTRRKAGAKRRAKPKVDAHLVADIAARIAGYRAPYPRHFIDQLAAQHGLLLTFDKASGGDVVVDMAGLKTKPAATVHIALTNWANKARRLALQSEAV